MECLLDGTSIDDLRSCEFFLLSNYHRDIEDKFAKINFADDVETNIVVLILS